MSSPSAPKVSTGNNNAQPLFTPPSGGDLTLRSRDGVDFRVHSIILKFVSSVFDDMITTRTTRAAIELTENAKEVSYLLGFIYPNRLPLTIDPDMLPGCLAAVQKYDVRGATELIDELITFDTPPYKFLSSDPIRAFQLAMRFNLARTRSATVKLIMADRVDFCDLNKASELAQKYSSQGLVHLMNVQAMRAKLLSDVLFVFDNEPIQPPEFDPSMYWSLSCSKCRGGNKEVIKKVPPSWMLAWVRLVYDTLLASSEPLSKSDYLFDSAVLEKFEGQEGVCQGCLADFRNYRYDQGPEFDSWARTIKGALEEQLARMELVYAL